VLLLGKRRPPLRVARNPERLVPGMPADDTTFPRRTQYLVPEVRESLRGKIQASPLELWLMAQPRGTPLIGRPIW
jgi:hypothetical protein